MRDAQHVCLTFLCITPVLLAIQSSIVGLASMNAAHRAPCSEGNFGLVRWPVKRLVPEEGGMG